MNITIVLLFLLFLPVGCGGGGGGSSSNNGIGSPSGFSENNRSEDARALENAPLTSGRLTQLRSADSAVDGASLIVPPGAVDKDVDVTVTATTTLPPESPWGHAPIGSLFVIGPSGLTFDSEKKAMLTLPIPPGGLEKNLFIGRWNEITKSWENVGGTIDGDFISVGVDHLSLYGIFSQGKSLVRIINEVVPSEDPGGQGIEIRYISGPQPPFGWPEDEFFPAYRPLPEGGVDLKISESQLMMLPPGLYHFAVSFPPPYQITNSMQLHIPELDEGADDSVVDQTITITGDDARSDDITTNSSLANFRGSWTISGSNEPPTLKCSANVIGGVAVSNRDSASNTLPSRRIGVGPIVASELNSTDVELTGTATDPEGGTISHYWTWSQFSNLPTKEVATSGEEVTRYFRPNPKREGRYDVYLTAYDAFNLFDECHWEITLRGNEKPTIEVIADDYVVDFGRFGSERIGGDSARDRYNIGAAIASTSWCEYVDTDTDGKADTTLLKTLPIEPASESPNHVYRPTQYPRSMTCVYAMIGDADGDTLETRFRFPFGGDLYDALTGDKITTAVQLDAYNAVLSSTITSFPVPSMLSSLAPQAQFALPIIWEAPDNVSGSAATDATTPTHDCRHLKKVSDEVGPCIDIPGKYPAGGITAIVATVSDGISREQIDGFGIGYGEDKIVRLEKSSSGNGGSNGSGGGGGANTPPTCNDKTASVNQGSSVTLYFSGDDVDIVDSFNLEYIIVGGPRNGSVDGNTYTPNGTYGGEDSITYVAYDGKAKSSTCEIIITVNEVRKWYVYKISGTGYRKTYGPAVKSTGYEYRVWRLFPSETDGIVGSNIDNTAACKNGPWALPSLGPEIWETKNVAYVGAFDRLKDFENYRCPVPNFITVNPICNGWVDVSDNAFYNNIEAICGG